MDPDRGTTNGASRRPLRIAFVWQTTPGDPSAISGMPNAMATSLERAGASLHHLHPPQSLTMRDQVKRSFKSVALCTTPASARVRLKETVRSTGAAVGHVWSRRIHQRSVELARTRSRSIQAQLEAIDADVVFGCCVSTLLCDLETKTPVVYFSDATAKLINEEYREFARRCDGYKRACDEIERDALSRTAIAIFASPWARDSAVRDYGVDPRRARIVPMGAHITPATPIEWDAHYTPPARDVLRICMIGADPLRKRLDLAIDAVEILRRRGRRATLTHIGRPTRRACASDACDAMGTLSLSSPQDRFRIERELARSHVMILPSAAEAFGIAPAEAAHFGKPSVVSDAGGLPSVVIDGETGVVTPRQAPARVYADAIESIVSSERAYRRMCQAAHRRAVRELSWEVWAERVISLLEEAASGLGDPGSTDGSRHRAAVAGVS